MAGSFLLRVASLFIRFNGNFPSLMVGRPDTPSKEFGLPDYIPYRVEWSILLSVLVIVVLVSGPISP
jgi:hypothetical protein